MRLHRNRLEPETAGRVERGNEIQIGSAPAPGAVFRAPAENIERAEHIRTHKKQPRAKQLDAWRVQQRPGRA
jgi:hypothetical protein